MEIVEEKTALPKPQMHPNRKIIHVDMDAFYASVEELDNPQYRGKPLVIGGDPNSRGVVCTANYEARKYGVHSAMPTSRAKKLCAHALFVFPRFKRYSEVSKQIQSVFHSYTDLVQPLSLDEAFLDVTDCKQAPTASEIAAMIKQDIFDLTGLTASAGVAPNKMLAKIASDINKPDGICIIKPHQVLGFVRSLEVRKIPGIGPVTAKKLKELGIQFCSDVWQTDPDLIEQKLGPRFASWIQPISKGIDHRKVSNSRVRKSFSLERTFAIDIKDPVEIKNKIETIVQTLAQQLDKAGIKGKTINFKLRYHDFKTITRAHSLKEFTATESIILKSAMDLFQQSYEKGQPVRLLGVGLSKLNTEVETQKTGWMQPTLFDNE